MEGYYFYVDGVEISRTVLKVEVNFIHDMQVLTLHQNHNKTFTVVLPKSKMWSTAAKVVFI